MKKIIQIVVLLFCVTAFSQEQKVDYKKVDNDMVQATYYFADNSSIVEQEGFFNKDGKLHGTWISFDKQGNKTTIANYNNGVKEGVWIYIKSDKESHVTYKENKIVDVKTKEVILN